MGYWEEGLPVGPFESIENDTRSFLVNLRIIFGMFLPLFLVINPNPVERSRCGLFVDALRRFKVAPGVKRRCAK